MSEKGAIVKQLQEAGIEERQAEAIAWQIIKNIGPQGEGAIGQTLGHNLLERIARVEEALEQFGKRFEMLIHQMDKRFEQVDKRLEQMDKRLEQQREEMNARFEQMDKRLEQQREEMNARLEQQREEMNARFEQVERSLTRLFWMTGGWGTLLAILMSLYQFLK